MKLHFIVALSLNLQGIYGQNTQPPPRDVPGYPPPTDFGCTTPYDAVDLAPDDLYYYFIGQYLYTETKLSTAINGPGRITDYFTALTLPVVAAFSTGPLNKLMYIIDSESGNNLKVFNFTSADPYPRVPTETTTVVSKFTGALPSPITAAFTSSTPARVYFFGGNATGPQVQAYSFNTATKTFAYASTGSSQWQNTIITAATTWYNSTSGVFEFYLFDRNTNLAEVDTALQFVPPNTPQSIYSCRSTIPAQMSGCCQLPPTTTLAPTPQPTVAPSITTTPIILPFTSGNTTPPPGTNPPIVLPPAPTVAGSTSAPASTNPPIILPPAPTAAGSTNPPIILPPAPTAPGRTNPPIILPPAPTAAGSTAGPTNPPIIVPPAPTAAGSTAPPPSTTAQPTTTTPQETATTSQPVTTTTQTTTTPFNPCPMQLFCNNLPDSAVNGDPCMPGDPTAGVYPSGTPDFLIFSGMCALPIVATGSNATTDGKLTPGIPTLISSLYNTSIIPVRKAYVDINTNTILEGPSGTVQSCAFDSSILCPQTCSAGPSLPADSNVTAYSTWFNTEDGSVFFVAVDKSGSNFFVTDGSMNYGGLVPVTTNQTMITNVTAVQHVAYTDYDADGNAINQRNYLYVFGTGAGSIKYFAIVQIFGIMSTQPSTPTGVATVLPNLQYVLQPVDYATIFGSLCP